MSELKRRCSWALRACAVGALLHSDVAGRREARNVHYLDGDLASLGLQYPCMPIHKLYMVKVTREHLYMAGIINLSLTAQKVTTYIYIKAPWRRYNTAVPAVFLCKQ